MLTGLGGKIMTYDGENRPLSVTHLGKRTCYVYGVDGKRLKKVEGLPPTQDCTALPANANATVYFGAVEVRNWKIAGQEQVLTYPHPAVKLLNGTTPAAATYLHRDGLSSVRAITNAAGAKIESALYKPFGEQSEWVLPGNAAPDTKGWIGERYDADAGLQYLNARYYDPELSLFLQPDWFEVTKNGVGTNRFSYSFNDPVNKFDPGGNQCSNCKSQDDYDKYHKDKYKEYSKKSHSYTGAWGWTDPFGSKAQYWRDLASQHRSLIGVPIDKQGLLSPEGQVALDLGLAIAGGVATSRAANGDELRPFKGGVGSAAATPKGFKTYVNKDGSLVHESPAGLLYGPDRKFGNRVDHVLAHTSADPSKPKHTVFNVGGDDALALVDEAWLNRGSPEAGDPMAFVVDMGRTVGTNGETSIKVIADPKTNYVVTAYPWSP
jgi:RHS repeat-associated protein